MTVRDKLTQLMSDNPILRNNDKMLIAYYIRDVYGLQNTFDIALCNTIKGNIFETIRRERQKIQEENPLLQPDPIVNELRSQKEQEMRERYRGV